MLKNRELFFERIVLLGQVGLVILSFLLSHQCSMYFASSPRAFSEEHKTTLALVGIIFPFFLYHYRQERLFRFASIIKHLTVTTKVVAYGTITLIVTANLLGISILHRFMLVVFPAVALCLLFLFHITFHLFLRVIRRHGRNKQSLMIVADDSSVSIIEQIKEEMSWGYDIVGICTKSERIIDRYKNEFKILKRNKHIDRYIDKNIVDEVLYCCQDNKWKEMKSLVQICAEVGVYLRVRADFLSMKGLSYDMIKMKGVSFLNYYNTPERDYSLYLKRVFDFVFSLGTLWIFSPVYLLIALLIKLDDGGSVFFSQPRVGRNGRIFYVLKFRTMVENAEELRVALEEQNEQKGPVFKIKNDPRITKVGAFLRKTSLDELPQFINVLLGDMSVVGPRPPLIKEVEEYERWQRRRLSVKPGITCIWQVSGRNNIAFNQWMELDLEYIDKWTFWGDIKLVFKTIAVMVKGDGN